MALSVASGSAALAQDANDNQARVLFDNGRELYDEGRYSDAIAAWKRAYSLSQRPLILFNMANAYERNGELRQAIDALNRYRAFAKPAEREVLLRRIRSMERRLEMTYVPNTPKAAPPKPFPVIEVSLISAGTVGVVTGALLGTASRSQGVLAQPHCAGPGMPCKREAWQFMRKERGLALGADLSFTIGFAAIAGGVTVWVLRSKKQKNGTGVSMAPTAEGMVFYGRF